MIIHRPSRPRTETETEFDHWIVSVLTQQYQTTMGFFLISLLERHNENMVCNNLSCSGAIATCCWPLRWRSCNWKEKPLFQLPLNRLKSAVVVDLLSVLYENGDHSSHACKSCQLGGTDAEDSEAPSNVTQILLQARHQRAPKHLRPSILAGRLQKSRFQSETFVTALSVGRWKRLAWENDRGWSVSLLCFVNLSHTQAPPPISSQRLSAEGTHTHTHTRASWIFHASGCIIPEACSQRSTHIRLHHLVPGRRQGERTRRDRWIDREIDTEGLKTEREWPSPLP